MPPDLAGVLRLLTLVALAVLPIALATCAATVMSARGHGDCRLSAATSHSLGTVLYVVAAGISLRLVWVGLRLWRASRAVLVRGAAARVVDRLPLEGGQAALVLPLAEPVAYTAGLARPQVVVSRGLLALLDEDERRALLAHEYAHAQSGHQRMLFVGGVVAHAFGFLAPVRRVFVSLRRSLEIAADDRALAVVGDPGVLARAIAKAALAAAPSSAIPHFGGSDLRVRLERLEHPDRSSRPATALAASGAMLTAIAVVVSACLAFHSGALLVGAAACLSGLGALVLPPLLRANAAPGP